MESLSPLPYGPLLEETMLTARLDYYKPTMSQFAHEQEPLVEATFTFRNRGEQRLLDYIDPDELQTRFDQLAIEGFNTDELTYMASVTNSEGDRVFTADYLTHIAANPLPPVEITIEDHDIAIKTTGDWEMAMFWETIVMSEVNEQYFENYVRLQGLDIMDIYDEGARRLDEKIAILQANPEIKFADFGTRRHFSLRWQKYVVERLKNECPDNFIGTSNVAFAHTMGLKPIGTFAHELPMGYAGLADARGEDIRTSHGRFLDEWDERYGPDLGTALTDTFTTDFFFNDFSDQQTRNYKALRHDSGDPVAFAEQAIDFYEAHGIDPLTKTIVFSDGLDIDTIVALHQRFEHQIGNVYGWGTTLTNDLGIKPLNVVMKLTHIQDKRTGQAAETVKLSDNASKHTGPLGKVALYKEIFDGIPVTA